MLLRVDLELRLGGDSGSLEENLGKGFEVGV